MSFNTLLAFSPLTSSTGHSNLGPLHKAPPMALRRQISSDSQDPHESWQEYLASVQEKCGSFVETLPVEECWYRMITLVAGPISVPCKTVDGACASSVLSTASVIYTSLYPNDAAAFSSSAATFTTSMKYLRNEMSSFN